MNWTFGIITSGENKLGAQQCFDSLCQSGMNWHHNECIVIGGKYCNFTGRTAVHIPFDETQRPGWITRKKNIIGQVAKYDKICIVHDYYVFEPNWLEGWYDFKNFQWKFAVNKIITAEGKRHSDWLINPEYMFRFLHHDYKNGAATVVELAQLFPHRNDLFSQKYCCGLPYDVRGLEKIQYASGGFVCVKKNALLETPMNELLLWGEAEDLDWSQHMNAHYHLSLNPHAVVKANRPNKWALDVLPMHIVKRVAEYYGLRISLVS